MKLHDLVLTEQDDFSKIVNELDAYTASPMHAMSSQLKHYLNSLPKPTGQIRLWRVIAIDSPEQAKQKLGIDSNELQVGKQVVLKPQKESSWTKSKSGVRYLINQMEDFGYDTAVVVETTVSGNDVLIDLEALPYDVKNQVVIDWPQREVIIDKPSVPATIVEIIRG